MVRWLLLFVAWPAEGGSYNDYIDRIEKRTSDAIALHRSGETAKALRTLNEVRDSFHSAVKLDSKKPDAYVTFAQSMLSCNQLEDAVHAWEGAVQRIDRKKEPHLFDWAAGRLRWTRYGLVSMQRDEVYAGGQGDLQASLKLIEKQLEIYPGFPNMHHDLATTRVMVSELKQDSNITAQAVESFRQAQETAFEAWKAGLLERKRSKNCDHGSLVYDWTQIPADAGFGVSVDYLGKKAPADSEGYVATFKDVALSGDDGIIVDEQNCRIFLASAGLAVNLAANLQLLEVWGDPATPYSSGPRWKWYDYSQGRAPEHGSWEKPVKVSKVASVVHFAATSHFHVLTEVLGRLWLLVSHGVLADPEMHLVLPKPFGFLAAGLKLLTQGLDLPSKRMIHWTSGPNDVRLRAETLVFANWKPAVKFGDDGGHCPTPGPLLRGLHSALQPLAAAAKPAPPALIFIKRKKGDMRSSLQDESWFTGQLKQLATPTLQFQVFDGSAKPKRTAQLFARARIVVGAHGGALSNILFCPEDVEIFELGFRTPFAGHYRYLSKMLNLRMTLLPLVPDSRGIGSQDIAFANLEEALEVIRAAATGPGEAKPHFEL
ncbi:unnamed protein product [Symbiodinium sp. CCMP2592]|nr:unnamed protein product [Symbiodinium sp. CCMP2592]